MVSDVETVSVVFTVVRVPSTDILVALRAPETVKAPETVPPVRGKYEPMLVCNEATAAADAALDELTVVRESVMHPERLVALTFPETDTFPLTVNATPPTGFVPIPAVVAVNVVNVLASSHVSVGVLRVSIPLSMVHKKKIK